MWEGGSSPRVSSGGAEASRLRRPGGQAPAQARSSAISHLPCASPRAEKKARGVGVGLPLDCTLLLGVVLGGLEKCSDVASHRALARRLEPAPAPAPAPAHAPATVAPGASRALARATCARAAGTQRGISAPAAPAPLSSAAPVRSACRAPRAARRVAATPAARAMARKRRQGGLALPLVAYRATACSSLGS